MGNIPSNEYWGNQLPRLIDYGKHGRLNLRSVKLYADGMVLFLNRSIGLLSGVPFLGALGSWGAALLAPYSDKPDSHGLMLNSPEILESLVRNFWKDGWQTVRRMVFFSQASID
jgi:predicted amidohydrolase YtcJ